MNNSGNDNFKKLTIVPVQDVMTCWIAHGVTKTMKVREMAAAHLEVVSHTLCSSKICFNKIDKQEVRNQKLFSTKNFENFDFQLFFDMLL